MQADGWIWKGGGSVPSIEIDPSHQAAVTELKINSKEKCVKLKKDHKLDDKKCDEDHLVICAVNKGAAGFGSSIAVPQYTSGTITCPLPPPDAPTSALMALSADQPELMCPGERALYECDAGGINVRQVSI